MEERYIRIGVAVVVRREGKILLGKRLVKAGYGQWGLPGGHLEYGESIVAGAKRELLEETDLVAENLRLRNITNDPREDRHYIHIVFEASEVQGDPVVTEPDKCEVWEWFGLHELPEPLFYGHKKFLDGIIRGELLTD